jgi:hypothetical protein
MKTPQVVRYRLKKDGLVYQCSPLCVKGDGTLEHRETVIWDGVKVKHWVLLKPGEFEIIPMEDYYSFRRETARQILCKLIEKSPTNADDNKNTDIVDEAIRLTDNLIEKLDATIN